MASFTGLALLCLLVLAVLGHAWGSVGAVDGVFSAADRKNLVEAVASQQQKDGSFGSLEDTYEAVSALLALKGEVKHKDDLCKYAAASLGSAKTSEAIFYAVSIAEFLNCGQAISKATATILNEAVAASDLHVNYFAIAAAYNLNLGKHLGGDFDRAALKGAVKRFADLAGSEGRFTRTVGGQESTYNSALAFQATGYAAALTDIDKEVVAEIADEVTNLLEAEALSDRDTGYLAFEDETGIESSLETTAEVIEGIDVLARLTGKPLGLKPEHVIELAQFFINLDDDVSDPESVHALATSLNLLAASPVHKPVSLVVVSETLTVGSKDQLRVRVTDIFGAPLSSKPKVTIVRARSRSDESPVANQAMSADGDSDFVYEYLTSKPEQGVYVIEFRVVPGAESALRYIRIVSAANVADVTLTVSDSKNADDANADSRKFSLENGKKLSEVIKAVANSHLHVFLRLKNAAARSVSAGQVAVRLVNQKTKEEEVFDAVQTTKGYRVHIDVAAAAAELGHASGLYKADLIVGDADLSNPLQWHIADIQISFPAVNDTEEAPLKPKKEIRHQFRPPSPRGSDAISRLFTLLVLSPWSILLIGLLALGANIRRFPFTGVELIDALAFLASIAAIFFLLYVYWLRLNMFQTLYYLAILAVPAVFFGSRALRYLHNAGQKQKKE